MLCRKADWGRTRAAPQNEILKGALAATGLVAVMASEEDDDVIKVPAVRLLHRPRPLRCGRGAPARRCGLRPAAACTSAGSDSHHPSSIVLLSSCFVRPPISCDPSSLAAS